MKKILLLMLLCVVQVAAFAQDASVTVKGVVQDSKGEPIMGAVVIVKNQPGLGSSTDVNGAFKITTGKYEILEVTYLGFEKQEVPVVSIKDYDNLVIVMKEQSQEVDEVVVTASGAQKKKTVTGAFTTVDVKQLNAPSGNLSNSLGGVVPGIITQQLSGEPGENQSDFWIRGISTFGANASALVLVDGIERSLRQLQPYTVTVEPTEWCSSQRRRVRKERYASAVSSSTATTRQANCPSMPTLQTTRGSQTRRGSHAISHRYTPTRSFISYRTILILTFILT